MPNVTAFIHISHVAPAYSVITCSAESTKSTGKPRVWLKATRYGDQMPIVGIAVDRSETIQIFVAPVRSVRMPLIECSSYRPHGSYFASLGLMVAAFVALTTHSRSPAIVLSWGVCSLS